MKSDTIREDIVRKTLEKIQSVDNMINKPHYDLSKKEEIKVQINIDNKVPHGLFLPDKKKTGSWITSEQTFRAMKKDIFSLGDSADDLVSPYTCESCRTELDKQFWFFCPYCSEKFRTL